MAVSAPDGGSVAAESLPDVGDAGPGVVTAAGKDRGIMMVEVAV